MKGEIIVSNLFNILIMAIVLETCISAFFSVTALKEQERKMVIKTMREALTYLVAFLICFSIPQLRTFAKSGLKLGAKVDLVITTLLLGRLCGFIKELVYKIKGE